MHSLGTNEEGYWLT